MISNTILEIPEKDPDVPLEARLKWLTHLIGTLLRRKHIFWLNEMMFVCIKECLYCSLDCLQTL